MNMKAVLYIIIALVVSAVIIDRLLARRDKRNNNLDLDNSEFDYGHNTRHDTDDEQSL